MGCTQGASKASASTQKPTTLLTGERAQEDKPTTAPEVLGETDATKATTVVVCTFKSGRLGLVVDGASGMVKAVGPGQGLELDVRVDWQMLFIDGQQFTAALLDAKIGGQDAYTITFAQATRSVACTFQPGKIGLTAASGMVTTVCPGQGQELGVEVGWRIAHIDGQPFTGDLLDSKIRGEGPYVITFALGGAPKIDQHGEQNVEEQKVGALVVASAAPPPRSLEKPEADGQNLKEQNDEGQKVDALVSDASLEALEPEAKEQKVEERHLAEQTPIAEPPVETCGVTRKQKPPCC